MINLQQKNVWFYNDDYPSTLTSAEMNDPLAMISQFFQTYSLPQAKRYLGQAIKYTLTDISTPANELRPTFYRFIIEIERIVDSAWVLQKSLPTKKTFGPDQFSKDYLTRIQNEDFISFLNGSEISNPSKAIHDFFNYASLCSWKKSCLEDMRKTIVDSSYGLYFDSHSLADFVGFSKLSKLLEGLFLLLDRFGYYLDHKTHREHNNWCTGQSEDFINWLGEYVKKNATHVSLQHFANICYAHRFHHDWNGYNTYKIFESYENVLQVTHAAIHVINRNEVSNSTADTKKNMDRFKTWSPGRITRFVSNLLITSRTFERSYKRYIPPQKEIDLLTQLIYLAHKIHI